MDLQKNIRERCHVNKNDEGDSFVGVKADTDDAVIYFPIGYQLPPNDDDLRADINNLFYVLAAFMKEDRLIALSGIATGASWLCYYYSIQNGVVSVVVPIDKLSIIVSVAFSYFVFKEKLSRKALAGLILIVVGTLAMAIWA